LNMLNKILADFEKAVKRLEEVLELKKTGVVRDSAIKRFELCFDLAWKSIKNYSKIQGIECYSLRECFKAAFQLKLIEHDDEWLRMIDDRNLTTHLYKESEAEKVYKNLPKYLEMFKNLFEKLKSA